MQGPRAPSPKGQHRDHLDPGQGTGTRARAARRSQSLNCLEAIAHASGFYCDFLGFTWQWQHQFEPTLPVYAQLERGGTILHLSEHHGDASPGGAVMILVDDIATLHADLAARQHRNVRPVVETNPWGRTMTILDPFSNRLIFCQQH